MVDLPAIDRIDLFLYCGDERGRTMNAKNVCHTPLTGVSEELGYPLYRIHFCTSHHARLGLRMRIEGHFDPKLLTLSEMVGTLRTTGYAFGHLAKTLTQDIPGAACGTLNGCHCPHVLHPYPAYKPSGVLVARRRAGALGRAKRLKYLGLRERDHALD